jgi:hypothetical protein
LVASSIGGRFGLGVCGSIRDTLSTIGFTEGTCGAFGGAETGAGAETGFFPVLGAKADLVTTWVGAAVLASRVVRFSAGLIAAVATGAFDFTPPGVLSLVFPALAGLEAAVRLRGDDFAAGFAVLRTAGALGAFDLVVVFVAI